MGRRRRSLAEGDLGSAADPSRQSMVRTEVGVLHEVELVYRVDDCAGAEVEGLVRRVCGVRVVWHLQVLKAHGV